VIGQKPVSEETRLTAKAEGLKDALTEIVTEN
jgi:hypothetical protein